MLQELVDYARQEQLTAIPGFKPKWIRWLLVFSEDGGFVGLHDYAEGPRSKGREFPACPDLTQQEMVAVGGGCRHFLVDSLDVVCLLTKDGKTDEKLVAKHKFFVNLLEQAGDCVQELTSVAAALRDEPTLESIRARLSEGKAKPMDLATLAVSSASGPSILVDRSDWHTWWEAYRDRLTASRKAKAAPKRGRKAERGEEQGRRMLCLLSGELVEPLPTHNKIEGLSDVGGLSMGDALVSFDKEAFGSFGLVQAANAAMGEAMVKTYVTALNHLIRNRSYRLAGGKVLYWYSRPIERDDDPLREMLEGLNVAAQDQDEVEETDDGRQATAVERVREKLRAESCARRLLDAIHSGQRPELSECRYYALTLTANSGRVVVRDWMEGGFEELLEAVNAWFEDLSIVSRDGRQIIGAHKFGAVLAAPLRELKEASPPLVAALWRSALKRLPIAHHVMAQTLQRVKTDLVQGETPLHARYGLLKAFCNRNERTPNMKPEVDDVETHPAYVAGRILAILGRIQLQALGDVGAGVIQRYYAAASATPALVIGRLVRTAQIAHLPKIERKGLRIWFENQLGDAWAKLSKPLPPAFTLEEQTLFAMGYYHQTAKRSAAKGENQNEDSPGLVE